MNRLDSATVELTDVEQAVSTVFSLALDSGLSVRQAASLMERLVPGLDPAFYSWLRDNMEPQQTSGIETFGTLEGRLGRAIRLAADGATYLVGFKDSGDPAKPYGLSWATNPADQANGTVYVRDLHGLIH